MFEKRTGGAFVKMQVLTQAGLGRPRLSICNTLTGEGGSVLCCCRKPSPGLNPQNATPSFALKMWNPA